MPEMQSLHPATGKARLTHSEAVLLSDWPVAVSRSWSSEG